MVEQISLQIILENPVSGYLSNRIIISDGFEESFSIMDKLDWGYSVAAKQIYDSNVSFIVMPIDEGLVFNYEEMYEGVYLIPLLWWHIMESASESVLVNDNFIEI